MNATPISTRHDDTHAADPNAQLMASENLEFKAQLVFGLKVLLGLAAVVAAAQSMSALTIWMYPLWAKWF